MEHRTQHESMARTRFPDGFRYMHGKMEYVTYRERSTIRVWYADTPWHYESHFHSAVEVIMPIRGEVVYTLPKRVYRVRADEVLIVPPNCIHDLEMQEGSARYLMLFEPDSVFGMRDMQQLTSMLNQPIYLSAHPALQEEVRGLLNQLVECYNRQDALWNAECYALLLKVYVCLGRHYLERMESDGEADAASIDSDVINSARLYIDNNCMHNITLDDMATFSGFSKYYFSRVFKQQLGVPFSEYLRRRRVNLAEDLLIHTRKSIQEVAVAAGFGSIATFNRVFRDVRRCSPSRYREIYGDI